MQARRPAQQLLYCCSKVTLPLALQQTLAAAAAWARAVNVKDMMSQAVFTWLLHLLPPPAAAERSAAAATAAMTLWLLGCCATKGL
jgi:hypothetical protein